MCQDHFSRRSFLHGATVLAAGSVLLPRKAPPRLPAARLPLRSTERAVSADGSSAYSMAMHIHSSFSEYNGSMDAQLYQATLNAVDVLWWTEHDSRMNGYGYRDTVHFTSLTDEKGAAGQGGAWHWQQQQSLDGGTGSGGIVTSPVTPNDPGGGSLNVTATSKSKHAMMRFGYLANSKSANYNYRDNLTGQSLSIDVLLGPGWVNGYLLIQVTSSYHQASAGRPAGSYTLSYRLTPGTAPVSSAPNGLKGVVTVPVNGPGGPTVTLTPASGGSGWVTVTISPSQDIAVLWPDMDHRDFSLYGLTLMAVSTGDAVSGYFGYLRFNRTMSGEAAFSDQAAMMEYLAPKYPAVTQQQALEISQNPNATVTAYPHMNWFGAPAIQDVGSVTPAQWREWLAQTFVPECHKGGGLASYNHPFGTASAVLTSAQQGAALAQAATLLLPSGDTAACYGADILEVGYTKRAGMDLAHHLDLWDIFSRNACFLTGNGASDDHVGQNWHGEENNWVTYAWAASTDQADLLAALAAGRAWAGSLSAVSTGTSLDMLVDGEVPMGAASVSSLTSRQLAITAAGIPAGGQLVVLQGAVDYAGGSDPAPNTGQVAAWTDTEMTSAGGQQTLTADTASDSFFRAQMLDASGNVVAVSNPVWLLQNAPPNGIPAPRQA